MPSELIIPSIVVVIATFIAAVNDLRTLKVHNLLTMPLFISGLLYHAYHSGIDGFVSSFLASLVCFFFLFMPYLLGGMGAGDVKLVAALGAWIGLPVSIFVIAAGLFITAGYALAKLAWQGRLSDSWLQLKISLFQLRSLVSSFAMDDRRERVHEMAKNPVQRKRLIPFSAMLFLGLILTLTWTWAWVASPF